MRAEDLAVLNPDASGAPVSVSARTGQVRTVDERVRTVRAHHAPGHRGQCQVPWSNWGD